MIESRNKIKQKYYKLIADKDLKLAYSFDHTIDFWNLMGLSYQSKIMDWMISCLKLFLKNPFSFLIKFREIAWSFKNLLIIKFKYKRVN